MSSVSARNVREIRELQFKDGSSYAGQVLETSTGALPYGYGCMTTRDGFRVAGLFKDGKSQGEGVFHAPNGDLFYGQWNRNHKRHGKGLSIRASDGITCVEEYDDGKLLKKVKRRPPAASTLHWLPPLSLPGTDERHQFRGDVPPALSGHSLTASRDGGLLVLFGGERANGELSNDVYVLDVASRVWVRPTTSGTVPPPMSGHTATLISGSRLVIIGGQLGGMSSSLSVYCLELESGVWSTPIAQGLSFMGHSATLIGQHDIWVIVQASVFVLHVGGRQDTWEWREVATENRNLPRQVPRSFLGHSAVGVGSIIYVYGGQFLGINHGEGKKYERLSNDLRVLHTDTLQWEAPPCTPPPAAPASATPSVSDYSGFVRGSWDVPRSEHTATLVGDTMYVIGGRTTCNPGMNVVDSSYLNDVQAIHLDTLQWQAAPALPLFIAPRAQHAVVHMQGELWCYGGRNSATSSMGDWNILHLPQAASATTAAAGRPATAAKPHAAVPSRPSTAVAAPTPAAAPVYAPAPAAQPARAPLHAAAPPVAARAPPPPVSASPAAGASSAVASDLISADSAGSGSILDMFLSGK